MSAKKQEPKITITRLRFKTPQLKPWDMFHILIEGTDGGVWEEVYPEDKLAIFLQGVQAGASTMGQIYLTIPEIPRAPTRIINLEPLSS